MSIRISVFGTVHIGDGPLKLPKKARALVAYLILQPGRRASRERLADLLWPYQRSEQARHSLRNCLLELRKVLSPDMLDGTYIDVGLTDAVTSDVDDFQTLATSDHLADLEAACSLHRGPFLDGLELLSEPWDDWLSVERDRLKALLLRTMLRVVKFQSQAGRHEDAITTGRRLLAVEPYCESGHRSLMRAYFYAERRPEALLQWNECVRALRRELDVEPSEKTLALVRWIKSTKVSPTIDDEGWERPLEVEVQSLRRRCEELESIIRASGLYA